MDTVVFFIIKYVEKYLLDTFFCDRIFIPIIYKKVEAVVMLKKYFEDDSYNIMPCGVVAFQNDSTLKIISANDYYYSTYANGNFESLNICEEDKNIIADLKDKNEVVYKCIVSDGSIRYICMHLTKYNENDILGILMDVTEQHTNLVRMKDERRCFTFALKSSKNIVFEHNVADDNMTLYIPVKGQTELKKLSVPNNTEDAVYELADKRDYGYLKENIFNEKVENISVRMKLPGNKNYEWHRIFRNFEHDEKGNLKRIFGTITNIEDEKHHEKELKEKIEIDPVLHVYNRNAGVERINEYIKSNPESRDYALFVIDIDDFKNINDTYGHLYGDTVIAMVAEMLNKATDDDTIVGRYGGDEFFVFLKSSRIAENADRVVDNVCKINISDDKRITCSVGVADGRIFEEVPDYKALFSKADKALYSTKKNGKAHWEIYNENIVYDNSSHAIDYEAEDAENSTELFKTRDMMKVFLELSSSAKNSDDAMYKIIRYVAEKFDIDWFQIMKVNTKEDLITISYEWCSDPKFQNNAGKRGYYAHSDIKHFKEFFEKYPVFILSNEKINGFSLKFQREFEKNKKNGEVVYNANITTGDSFFMFVCTRFGYENPWQIEECVELNMATKLMTMYISQSDKETENEKKLRKIIDYDRKTSCYTIAKFYEQIGRLRKFAEEKDEQVALLHTDFSGMLDFNERFGQIEGDKVFTEFVNCILPSDNDYNIITHIDGADIFFSAFRFKNLESFDKIDALNKQFSKMINEKYPGAHIIVKTGIYVLKTNEVVGVGLDKALKAKKTVKNPTESFCIVYDKDKHENSCC